MPSDVTLTESSFVPILQRDTGREVMIGQFGDVTGHPPPTLLVLSLWGHGFRLGSMRHTCFLTDIYHCFKSGNIHNSEGGQIMFHLYGSLMIYITFN